MTALRAVSVAFLFCVLPAGCGGAVAKVGPGGDAGPAADGATGSSSGGTSSSGASSGGSGSGGSSGGSSGGGTDGSVPPPPPATKLDLLFVVSNDPFVMPAQPVFQESVQAMIDRLLNPNCVDGQGNVFGPSQNGACTQGQLEFQPVHDMHIGILSSALGSRGGDLCPDTTDPSNSSLSAHDNDNGELLNRAGASQAPLGDASPSNFLAWFPNVPGNQGQPQPADPAVLTEATLVSDFTQLLSGVDFHGCGFGAPLEAAYRFLVQPDPYASITVNNSVASFTGIDETIIQQRHDFLRPDSAVGIVVLSTEDERTMDPLAMNGQGWAFENQPFPGSESGGGAPEGTAECQTNPEDPSCTSCALVQGGPNFATECPNDGIQGMNGYLDPSDDAINLRTFHMKQRFGIDTELPVTRYVSGLSAPNVPDSAHEHDSTGNYSPTPNCVNPLFAASLPAASTDELCALTPGTRQPSQVFFTVITGVPFQLLQVDSTNPNSPQKATLSASDWNTVLGADPLQYDFTGADFHMLESENPRAGSACPTSAADDCDPISGREIVTNKSALQFACIFTLEAPIDCTQPQYSLACSCASTALYSETPLCQMSNGSYTQTQIKGGAVPGIRELSVARGLGGQAVVSSVCPIHTTEAMPGDPLYAHRPALLGLVDKLSTVLQK